MHCRRLGRSNNLFLCFTRRTLTPRRPPQTTDADPALDGHRCPYHDGDDCETPRAAMTPDQAKAYCIAQPWCVGFEYGSESIFFKYEMCPIGRWEGAGNGLYLLGGSNVRCGPASTLPG